ncbi:MAG: hypothetical protein JXA99_14465 [Candidatus Lokiarchaeota archaeon]|nr:hypothetical protein [Candidatus Lokiarchaeota archaeon]
MKKEKILIIFIFCNLIILSIQPVIAEKIENSEVGVNSDDKLLWKITHPITPLLPEELISFNVTHINKMNNNLVLNASISVFNVSGQWESECINKAILTYNYSRKFVEFERQLEMTLTRGRIMILTIPIPLNLTMIGLYINTTSIAKVWLTHFDIEGKTLIMHYFDDSQDLKMTFNDNGILEKGDIISSGIIVHSTQFNIESKGSISFSFYFLIPLIIGISSLLVWKRDKVRLY